MNLSLNRCLFKICTQSYSHSKCTAREWNAVNHKRCVRSWVGELRGGNRFFHAGIAQTQGRRSFKPYFLPYFWQYFTSYLFLQQQKDVRDQFGFWLEDWLVTLVTLKSVGSPFSEVAVKPSKCFLLQDLWSFFFRCCLDSKIRREYGLWVIKYLKKGITRIKLNYFGFKCLL